MASNSNFKAMMKALKLKESSGGLNTDHPEQGERTTPVGEYGLKPEAVDTILNRNPDMPYQGFKGMTSAQLSKALANPAPEALRPTEQDPEDVLVQQSLEDALVKHSGDPIKAMAAYNQGPSLSTKSLTERLNTDPKLQSYIDTVKPAYEEAVNLDNKPNLDSMLNVPLLKSATKPTASEIASMTRSNEPTVEITQMKIDALNEMLDKGQNTKEVKTDLIKQQSILDSLNKQNNFNRIRQVLGR